jgi:hypothetical protein
MIHKITLTETELQALVGLLDAGVRATGLRSVNEAAPLLSRIEGAEKIEDSTVEVGAPE